VTGRRRTDHNGDEEGNEKAQAARHQQARSEEHEALHLEWGGVRTWR